MTPVIDMLKKRQKELQELLSGHDEMKNELDRITRALAELEGTAPMMAVPRRVQTDPAPAVCTGCYRGCPACRGEHYRG